LEATKRPIVRIGFITLLNNMDYSFDLRAFVLIGAFAVLLIWGVWELVDWALIDDYIVSTKPIIPEIKLTITNNTIDTLYVYRQP
jgi:hypothetical protein